MLTTQSQSTRAIGSSKSSRNLPFLESLGDTVREETPRTSIKFLLNGIGSWAITSECENHAKADFSDAQERERFGPLFYEIKQYSSARFLLGPTEASSTPFGWVMGRLKTILCV